MVAGSHRYRHRGPRDIHAIWYGREQELAGVPWLGEPLAGPRAGAHAAVAGLGGARGSLFPGGPAPPLSRTHTRLVESIAEWWQPLGEHFECPYCALARPMMAELVKAKPNARVCYLPFPLSAHPNAIWPSSSASSIHRTWAQTWRNVRSISTAVPSRLPQAGPLLPTSGDWVLPRLWRIC